MIAVGVEGQQAPRLRPVIPSRDVIGSQPFRVQADHRLGEPESRLCRLATIADSKNELCCKPACLSSGLQVTGVFLLHD